MGGVDKEKVQRTVYEMSKGSKYFENEERKEAFTRRKIESMRVQCSKLTPEDISHYQMVHRKKSKCLYCVCILYIFSLQIVVCGWGKYVFAWRQRSS